MKKRKQNASSLIWDKAILRTGLSRIAVDSAVFQQSAEAPTNSKAIPNILFIKTARRFWNIARTHACDSAVCHMSYDIAHFWIQAFYRWIIYICNARLLHRTSYYRATCPTISDDSACATACAIQALINIGIECTTVRYRAIVLSRYTAYIAPA